ncbi:MAG: hypothetical protein IK083_05570 [Abditibacteriota bacterium]|nr:hypothetical protein [Abditibacteriota bacterium]
MSYSVLGADGAVYGPCSRETLAAWVREGSVTAGSVIICEDGSRSAAGVLFPELFADTDGLNWPGLFLAPFWGISHRLWQGWACLGCWILSAFFLIVFVFRAVTHEDYALSDFTVGILLYVIFVLAACWLGIYMLFRGKAAARKTRRFRDEQEFRDVQSKWERAVAIIVVVYTSLVTFNLLQSMILMMRK